MSRSFLCCYDQIFFKLAGNEAGIKSRNSNFYQIGSLPTELGALERLKQSHRRIMGKWCLQASSFIFDRIFVKIADNQNRHKISDEFEFRPDLISNFGVTRP